MATDEHVEKEETLDSEGADPNPSETDASMEASVRFDSALAGLKKRSRLLIAGGVGVLLLLTAVWGTRIVLHSGEAAPPQEPARKSRSHDGSETRLLKQDLDPFYIPLQGGGNGKIARLRLSVTWAPTTADRFREKEVLIRDRLYRRITQLASKGENLHGMALTIRTEAQNILEELLRPNELRVAVTGIFVV